MFGRIGSVTHWSFQMWFSQSLNIWDLCKWTVFIQHSWLNKSEQAELWHGGKCWIVEFLYFYWCSARSCSLSFIYLFLFFFLKGRNRLQFFLRVHSFLNTLHRKTSWLILVAFIIFYNWCKLLDIASLKVIMD
jgi:hypothetical protein